MNEGKRYAWIVVALLWGVALLNYTDRQMLTTMKAAMQVEITDLQSATNFGYLMAIFLWVYGLMSPLSGLVADKFNRKWLIVGSLFVWSGVTWMMGYATTFSQLYFLRAVMGVSEALYIPAGLSLIADFHRTETRSLAVGIHMTGFYIGQALGGWGAAISSTYSWQEVFFSLGLIGITYSAVLILFLKEPRKLAQENVTWKPSKSRTPSLFSGLPILLSSLSFWVILFYFAAPSLPGWAVKNWLPTLFSNNLGIKMDDVGPIAATSLAASSFIGVIMGGLLSDFWVQRNLRGRLYTSAIGLTITIPALFLLSISCSLFQTIIATIFFGIGFGMFDTNNVPILCQFVSTRHRAAALGLMNMVGVFAGALATKLLGRSMDAGHLQKDFAMLGIFMMAAIALQLILLKPNPEKIVTNAYEKLEKNDSPIG